jgi:hypothetical protein
MTNSLDTCPQCGSPTRRAPDGASLVVACSHCAWKAVTSSGTGPPWDPQRYSVFASCDLARRDLAVRLAIALGARASEMLTVADGSEPLARAVDACEVLRLAGLLAPRGIGVRTEPPFPWPVPATTSAG